LVSVLNTGEDELTTGYRGYNEPAPDDAITFDEFVSNSFAAKTFNGSWWSNSELQWKDEVLFKVFHTIKIIGVNI